MKKIGYRFLFLFIILISLLFFSEGFSQENQNNLVIGKIVKFEGKVYVKGIKDIKPHRIKKEVSLKVGDCIKTKMKSRAFIKFIDGCKVVLDENSILCIQSYKKDKLKKGRVFYKIRKGVKGKRLAVSNILIGVKGTKFAVNFNGTCLIAVKEGTICVENLKGQFKKYKKKVIQEFESFKKKHIKEFKKYKERMQKEFYEYVKKFKLGSGEAVSIKGNEVISVKIPEEMEKGFSLLDAF